MTYYTNDAEQIRFCQYNETFVEFVQFVYQCTLLRLHISFYVHHCLKFRFISFVFFSHSPIAAETTLTSDGPDANGLFTESAKLSIVLSRKALAGTFECRIESEALDTVSRHHLNMDLQGNEMFTLSAVHLL